MLATTTVDRRMEEALASLPEATATVVLLASRTGLTYREIAARLGEEPATILRRLTEGLRALRQPGGVAPAAC
ncbi:MAG: hypothetical protein M3Q68_03895 [Actinomycetota bacterium]|nr:hypothetical protein [Actinomycetota bacterium]